MIERGHVNVWDYGWTFYKNCLDVIEEDSKKKNKR